MKTKNLILGLAAVVFAIGSAFSARESSTTLVDAYVRAKMTQFASFTCRVSDKDCDVDGTQPCFVQIVTSANGTKTVRARNSDCTALLNNTSDSPISALVIDGTPYDVE